MKLYIFLSLLCFSSLIHSMDREKIRANVVEVRDFLDNIPSRTPNTNSSDFCSYITQRNYQEAKKKLLDNEDSTKVVLPAQRDVNGNSPLFSALGSYKMTALLLAYGANPNQCVDRRRQNRPLDFLVNKIELEGTPITNKETMVTEYHQLIKLLINAGADLNQIDENTRNYINKNNLNQESQ